MNQALADIEASEDVTDWLAIGYTVEGLWQIVERLPDWKFDAKGNGHDAGEAFAAQVDAEAVDGQREQAKTPVAIPYIDVGRWDATEPPARQWLVKDRIPLRQPTLFSGHGATGKTLIALQLAVATVLGRDWLQLLPEPGRVIYFGAEDEADELHRRLSDIAAFCGVRFRDLAEAGLQLVSLAGEDALLGIAGRDGIVKPTPLFAPDTAQADRARHARRPLLRRRKQPRPGVPVHWFDAQAGDRRQRRRDDAVTPSLTGLNTGSGLSGTTGWYNGVRAQLYLKSVTEDDDDDLRELHFKKSNYSKRAERLPLIWEGGMFKIVPGVGRVERAAADAKADDLFLKLLARFIKQGRDVSDRTGTNYAPSKFAGEAEAMEARIKKDELAAAMARLLTTNRIHVDNFGRPSRPSYRLRCGPQPDADPVGDGSAIPPTHRR